ncbi:ABZJ_00895 family protein [Pseudophaeobacter leonis]|uniref:ABZJ_00895 family protein n=1 Tax=Pseudophaeobacter leonis TaxID=1144477 RepID=UPI0009F22565|nr:ABZJ_00895 family protein [Pseudophaeobacter leonis]
MSINLKRYALIYVATVVVLMLVTTLLSLAGITLPASLSTLLPTMMAAMTEGRQQAGTQKQPLGWGAAWKAAIPMTVCGVAVAFTASVLFLFVAGGVRDIRIITTIGFSGWAFALILIATVTYVCNAVFLRIGLNNQLKARAKAAAGK